MFMPNLAPHIDIITGERATLVAPPDDLQREAKDLGYVFDRIAAAKVEFIEYTQPPDIITDRIGSFCKRMGLSEHDVYYLYPENRRAFEEAVSSIAPPEDTPEWQGEYNGVTDTARVHRDKQLESENGVQLTESFGVHEVAHASGGSNLRVNFRESDVRSDISNLVLRSGFSISRAGMEGLEKRNIFLEEGFAELMRGLYVHKFLNRPNGFGAETASRNEAFSELPRKYDITNKGEVSPFGASSLAAYAVELLIMADPSIASSIVAARYSGAALRDLYQKINAIDKHLVGNLRKLSYSSQDFGKGLGCVAMACGPGVRNEYSQDKIAATFGFSLDLGMTA